ncbi:hypothetical protein ACFL05_00325 [Patescibacteria group bacterium]
MPEDARKYPCKAVVVNEEYLTADFKKLTGKEVVVLTSLQYERCCCGHAHRIELPEGFPEPPEGCPAWMINPKNLHFED